MKAFILQQITLLRSLNILSDTLRVVSWLFSLMISAYLLINLAIPLYQTATHKGYVFATDNDGGRAIETSIATRWYNSNHFAPYGNLYYRFSHTLAGIVPLEIGDLTPQEAESKNHHFALKIVSLFSVFALGLFIGWTLFGTTYVMPLFGSFFMLVTLKIPMWSEWVFRPHPEHLLNYFTAIAVFMFARFLSKKENGRLFILSAFAWGLAMAVKRSTSMFIPGILLVMLFPWSKRNLHFAAKYVGYMLFAYLLVGFPQNFGFYKHIKFLLYESSLHSMGDLESMSKNLFVTASQLCYLLPLILVGCLFSQNRQRFFSWKFFLVIALSFIPILMRKMSFVGDHHTIPLAIGTMMLVLVLVLQYLPWRINSNLAAAVCLIIGIRLVGISPEYAVMKKTQTACYESFDQITQIVSAKISDTNKLVKEPFFPSNDLIDRNTTAFWGIDWSKINKNVAFIGTTTFNSMKYLNDPPKDFYGKMIENWEEKKQFYNAIMGKTSVTSPSGIEYKKIYVGNCGHELWMASNR